MDSHPKKSSGSHQGHGSHSAPSSHSSVPKADDDPLWNPGKPLADLITFMEYED